MYSDWTNHIRRRCNNCRTCNYNYSGSRSDSGRVSVILTVYIFFLFVSVLYCFLHFSGLISGFKTDENIYLCPETLMVEILKEVHYLPDTWRGHAHTTLVRDQFAQFFQYKWVKYFVCTNYLKNIDKNSNYGIY